MTEHGQRLVADVVEFLVELFASLDGAYSALTSKDPTDFSLVRVCNSVLVIAADAGVTREAIAHARVEVTQTTLGTHVQTGDGFRDEHLADVTISRVPRAV